jgi:hypothetical protein
MKIIIFFHNIGLRATSFGKNLDLESQDVFLSDTHIITICIISIFAIILAVMGICFFLKLCKDFIQSKQI